jgi:hypothetical protein
MTSGALKTAAVMLIKIAKVAYETNRTVRDVAREISGLGPTEIEKLLDREPRRNLYTTPETEHTRTAGFAFHT